MHQQGTWSPDATHRWMASTAMDSAGNLAIAYNASSATIYPSIRYAARLAGDPLGTLGQGEQDILAGVGSQTSSSSRWGDYSNLSVDPNGCTFWATLEYSNQGNMLGPAPWRTRIAAFRLPNCVDAATVPSAPALTATASSSNVVLNWTDATGETNYDVQRCNGAGCGPATIVILGAGVLTYTDVPDASSSPYTYRVNARNGVGSTSSNSVTVTFPPPTSSLAAPTNLKASALRPSGVALTWTDNATGETKFEVRRTGGAGAVTFTINGSNATSYTDASAASHTSYTYPGPRVRRHLVLRVLSASSQVRTR